MKANDQPRTNKKWKWLHSSQQINLIINTSSALISTCTLNIKNMKFIFAMDFKEGYEKIINISWHNKPKWNKNDVNCWRLLYSHLYHVWFQWFVRNILKSVFVLTHFPEDRNKWNWIRTSENYERIYLNKYTFFLNLAFGQVGEKH